MGIRWVGVSINLYELKYTEKISEDEELFFYEHKLGGQVIFVKNNDDNRVFSATFKTLPNDNKGIPHILEHCTLCGSKKYPLKDPFNDLASNTVYTYLNAITYKDKTIYPVASYNAFEFDKLFKVYIDAVINPLLKKEVFMQEAVRVEENGFGNGILNGVVLNEMEGYYSDVEEQIRYYTFKNLFEDTQYKYDSGGVPDEIKKVSHEDVQEYHKKKYGIQKSFLYFYGNLEIEKYLNYIEENYYSDITDRVSIDQRENLQIPIEKYECIQTECSINYYTVSYAMEEKYNFKDIVLLEIYLSYLMDSQSSPFTNYLSERFECEEVSYDFETDILQPVVTIYLKTNGEYSQENIKKTIAEYLTNVELKNINHKMMRATLESYNFELIDEDYGYKPRGLGINMDLINSWLYNQRPEEFLQETEMVKKFLNQHEEFPHHYVVNKFFVENKFCLGLKVEKENYENQIANDGLIHITEELRKEMENYRAYQNSNDPQNDLIPTIDITRLQLSELPEFELTKIDGAEIYHYDDSKNKVSYISIVFDTSCIEDKDLHLFGLWLCLLMKVKTKNMNLEEIDYFVNTKIGTIDFDYECFDNVHEINTLDKFEIKIKFFKENFGDILQFLKELFKNSDFSDKKLILRELVELNREMEDEYNYDPMDLCVDNSLANIDYGYYRRDKVVGLTFYEYIGLMVKNKKMLDEECSKLEKSINSFLYKNKLKIYTNLDIKEKNAHNELKNFLAVFENNGKNHCSHENEYYNPKSDFLTNNNVNYLCRTLRFTGYCGELEVIGSIIRNKYFMDEIRIKGGAYGYDFKILKNGIFVMSSYKDPRVEETFEIFRNINDYLDFEQIDINKYKISTVNYLVNNVGSYNKFTEAKYYNLIGYGKSDIAELFDKIKRSDTVKLKSKCNFFGFGMQYNESCFKKYTCCV